MARTVRVVVQARMSSSRLPGKIVKPLAGRPILAHVVRRLQAAARFRLELPLPRWEVLVATSTAPADKATVQLCRELNVACFRGPEHDVLARYLAACADLGDDDLIVRATADNPLYCPSRAAAIVGEHLQRRADYTSIENLSYVVPEVMRCGALRAIAGLACRPEDREHVTPYFRQTSDPLSVTQLASTWRRLRPEIRLTVDTPAEYERMAAVFEALGDDPSLEEVYALWDAGGIADCGLEADERGARSAECGAAEVPRIGCSANARESGITHAFNPQSAIPLSPCQQLRQVQHLDRLALAVQSAADVHQASGVG